MGTYPDEAKAAFLADVEKAQKHLGALRKKEASWAASLVAELTARLRKRLLSRTSVAARIAAIGYPSPDQDIPFSEELER